MKTLTTILLLTSLLFLTACTTSDKILGTLEGTVIAAQSTILGTTVALASNKMSQIDADQIISVASAVNDAAQKSITEYNGSDVNSIKISTITNNFLSVSTLFVDSKYSAVVLASLTVLSTDVNLLISQLKNSSVSLHSVPLLTFNSNYANKHELSKISKIIEHNKVLIKQYRTK